jgi:hypothetical protein
MAEPTISYRDQLSRVISRQHMRKVVCDLRVSGGVAVPVPERASFPEGALMKSEGAE